MLPYYFISASYLSHCLLHNDLNVSLHSLYNKRFKLNRCTIATSQGPLLLSVPLLHGRNQKALLSEVQIDYKNKWTREHIHSIKTVYGKAPFYIHYCDAIYEILECNEKHLLILNVHLINRVLELLHFSQRVGLTEDVSGYDEQQIPLYEPLVYQQLFQDRTGFVPHCAIIDLLFNCGPDTKQILLQQ